MGQYVLTIGHIIMLWLIDDSLPTYFIAAVLLSHYGALFRVSDSQ